MRFNQANSKTEIKDRMDIIDSTVDQLLVDYNLITDGPNADTERKNLENQMRRHLIRKDKLSNEKDILHKLGTTIQEKLVDNGRIT